MNDVDAIMLQRMVNDYSRYNEKKQLQKFLLLKGKLRIGYNYFSP